MKNKIVKIYNKVLDVIFPKNFKCVFCDSEIFDDNSLCTCEECNKTLPFITGKVCQRCGCKIYSMADYCIKCKDSVRFFDQAKAPFEYEEPVSNAIKKLKTANARYLAEPLAKYLSKSYYESGWKVDKIMCVPSHPSSEKKRGFNHAKLLATTLAKIVDLPFDDNLQKVKKTAKQTEMDFIGRQTNLQDAFKYNGNCVGQNVMVVDDVMTTGATMNTICYELKRKGANKVYVLTVARTSENRNKNKKNNNS